MDFFATFWKKVVEFLVWFFNTLLLPLRWMLDGIFWILGHAAYWIFNGLLTAIQLSFSAIDFSAVLFNNTLGSSMHPLLVWFINQLGIPQCFSLIGTAIGIRMLLNLLPASVTRI